MKKGLDLNEPSACFTTMISMQDIVVVLIVIAVVVVVMGWMFLCFALLWFLVFGKIKEEKKQNDTKSYQSYHVRIDRSS